jgi:HAD superfamily hydrolase (TIGR01459 family)
MGERIAGLRDVANAFDAFLIDQVGVLHDGHTVYPGAAEALSRLRATGRPIAVVSNSGKRAGANRKRLTELGVDAAAVDAVVTSGECAREALECWRRTGRLRLGAGAMLFTRDGETALVDGLDLGLRDDPADVDLVIVAGVRPEKVTFAAYAERMQQLADLGVPALCANPDTRIFAAGEVAFGPGAVAAHYAACGGTVTWIGKPNPTIFQRALSALGGPDAGRTLVIGDSPEHDGQGAARTGCPWLFVSGGMYADAVPDRDRNPCAAAFTIDAFTW